MEKWLWVVPAIGSIIISVVFYVQSRVAEKRTENQIELNKHLQNKLLTMIEIEQKSFGLGDDDPAWTRHLEEFIAKIHGIITREMGW